MAVLADWQRGRRQMFPKTVAALQTANKELGGAAAAVDSVELQTAKEASYAVHRTPAKFPEAPAVRQGNADHSRPQCRPN